MSPEKRAPLDIVKSCAVATGTVGWLIFVGWLSVAHDNYWPYLVTMIVVIGTIVGFGLHHAWTQKVHRYRREEEEK